MNAQHEIGPHTTGLSWLRRCHCVATITRHFHTGNRATILVVPDKVNRSWIHHLRMPTINRHSWHPTWTSRLPTRPATHRIFCPGVLYVSRSRHYRRTVLSAITASQQIEMSRVTLESRPLLRALSAAPPGGPIAPHATPVSTSSFRETPNNRTLGISYLQNITVILAFIIYPQYGVRATLAS